MMYESKLMATLKIFSKEEIDALNNFFLSPYYFSGKEKEEVYPLFEYIYSRFGNWTTSSLDRAKVYEVIFKDQALVKGKLDKLMSKLLKHIYSFIRIHFKKHKNEQLENSLVLVDFFRKGKARKFEEFFLDKARKEYDKIDLLRKEDYYVGFLIGAEEFQKHYIYTQSISHFDISKSLESLDVYYIIQKLEYTCFLLALDQFRRPVEVSQLISFLDALKPAFRKKGLLEIPLVATYYQVYELLKNIGDGEEPFKKLKTIIRENEKLIPFETLKILVGLVRGVIIIRSNNGDQHLMEELFLMHKEHLERGYLNFEEGILASTFKNMVTMGLRSKDFEWVEQFLEKYKSKIIGARNTEEIYHYNLAFYFFALKEYEKAYDLLNDQYEDLYYKLAAKRLELKIYFETSSSLLDSKMDAFKIYVFRLSKVLILDQKRSSNNNFINFLRQLRNPKTIHDSGRIEKLIQKINKTKLLTERNWLLEKLHELKK